MKGKNLVLLKGENPETTPVIVLALKNLRPLFIFSMKFFTYFNVIFHYGNFWINIQHIGYFT
jgi:hypothetical protein